MLFVLSKVIALFLSPLVISAGLAVLAILVKRLRRKLVAIALVVLFVFSNPMLFRLTIQWWEGTPEPMPTSLPAPFRIVVLGGMSSFHPPSGRVRLGHAGDRLFQALVLLNQNPGGTLVVSGGSAALFNPERGEAAFLLTFLDEIGIDASRVQVDSLSRNTRENAVNSAGIFDRQGWEKSAALVTSAWHMPRARAAFEKEGFEIIEINADHMYPFSNPAPTDWFLPSARVLLSWELLFKEWVGLLAYKLKGYA